MWASMVRFALIWQNCDPNETKNVLEENPERVTALRTLLIDALKNREEGYTDGYTLLVGKTPVTVLQHTEVL